MTQPDVARGGPGQDRLHDIDSPGATIPCPADVAALLSGFRDAALLELSDRCDVYLARIGDLERQLCAAQDRISELEKDFERGFVEGALMIKRQIANEVDDLRQHLVTWDGYREDFGKPRPGDFPGLGDAA